MMLPFVCRTNFTYAIHLAALKRSLVSPCASSPGSGNCSQLLSSLHVEKCSVWLTKNVKRRWSSRNVASEQVNVPEVLSSMFDRSVLTGTFPGPLRYELEVHLKDVEPCVYSGFDPTGPSLHVGNLLVLMALLHMYAAGFNVIAVVGGATGRLGDPSGRNSERPYLSDEEIRKNLESLVSQIDLIFNNFRKHFFQGNQQQLKPVRIINNSMFYKNISSVEFLSSIGRNFKVGKMQRQHAIRKRLETTGCLSFAELTYQIMQAHDWLKLYENFGCRFQVGGTDQVGNIESGRDYAKKIHDVDLYGLLLPIITSETGSKYGKSAGNAVWLSAEKTCPFEFYQFFMRTPDLDVQKSLQLFTFYPLNQVDEIFEKHMRHPGEWSAQKKLAEQITLLVHGEEGLLEAFRCTEALYGNTVDSLARLSAEELESVFRGVPIYVEEFDPSMNLLQLSLRTECFQNVEDGERIIRAGGLYVNNIRLNDPEIVIVPGTHILPGSNVTVLRTGKRHYTLVKWDFMRSAEAE